MTDWRFPVDGSMAPAGPWPNRCRMFPVILASTSAGQVGDDSPQGVSALIQLLLPMSITPALLTGSV